jgi:hypothetical protein
VVSADRAAAAAPNSGMVDSLEEAEARFKRRIKGRDA